MHVTLPAATLVVWKQDCIMGFYMCLSLRNLIQIPLERATLCLQVTSVAMEASVCIMGIAYCFRFAVLPQPPSLRKTALVDLVIFLI